MIYPLRGSITECLHNTQAAHNFISSQSPFNLSLKAYQISINPSSLVREQQIPAVSKQSIYAYKILLQ